MAGSFMSACPAAASRLRWCRAPPLTGCTLASIATLVVAAAGISSVFRPAADRLVLASLSPADIEDVSAGRHQMDAHVRQYIHENLGYRFVILPDGKAAREVEQLIKNGGWTQGKPLLN